MLAIKLKPIGKKHQISYRVVVTEKRSKLTGRFVEDLGFYNPQTKESNFRADRVKHWIFVGAQPTNTVHNLFVKAGIVEGAKKPVKMKEPEKKVVEEAIVPTVEEKKEEAKREEKVGEEVVEGKVGE